MARKCVLVFGAMEQEIAAFEPLFKYRGKWSKYNGYPLKIGVGKTNVAARLSYHTGRGSVLDEYFLIFTGVAAALDENLKIGDIGVVRHAIDADMDVRAWDNSYRRGEVPFSRERVLHSDEKLAELVKGSGVPTFDAYVATGSKFLDAQGKREFCKDLDSLAYDSGNGIIKPNLYDMESSAFLKFNHRDRRTLELRVVSDTLEGNAPEEFNQFIENAVESYVSIVGHVLEKLDEAGELEGPKPPTFFKY